VKLGSSELPQSPEEAYREMLGMPEDQENPSILKPQGAIQILTPNMSKASEAEVVSKTALQQCESAVTQLTEVARLEFNVLRTKLDENLEGFDDKMRKCEQRAIAAEEKSSILAKHLESNKRVISDLNG
jgi:hypothetical protein